MIDIREQIDSDTKAVESIIATATDELRSIYRPIKPKVLTKTQNQISIVATIKGNVVGSAELLFFKNSALVQGIAVSPTHRRQGVARAIIQYAILKAQKEGKSKLVLSTIKETGNANIFLHMGFTVVSEEISEIFESVQGETVTLIKMTKGITSR